MKRKIECINFDLDSVLYVPSEFLETTLLMSIKTMIQTGLKAGPSEALQKLKEIRTLDSNAKDHFDQLCLYFNKSYDPLIIAAGVERYWDCKIGIMTSAPESNVVLSILFNKYPLTIISNGPPLKQAGKLVRLGLSHYFSQHDTDLNVRRHLFYCTSEIDKVKPHPYLWLQAQEEIGYRFSRAVMVGDRYWNDIFGAKRLGMITIKINQGAHARETIQEVFEREWRSKEARAFFSQYHSEDEVMALMEPDHVVDSLKEIEKVIQEIERGL
jgi:putative hydrolase of the HAD superfamily